jgi:hypothetical protein
MYFYTYILIIERLIGKKATINNDKYCLIKFTSISFKALVFETNIMKIKL